MENDRIVEQKKTPHIYCLPPQQLLIQPKIEHMTFVHENVKDFHEQIGELWDSQSMWSFIN